MTLFYRKSGSFSKLDCIFGVKKKKKTKQTYKHTNNKHSSL